jgi:uncharacterized protein (UPF0128 family)
MKKLSDFFKIEGIHSRYKCYEFSNHNSSNNTGFHVIITVGAYDNFYSDPPNCDLNLDTYKNMAISLIRGNIDSSKIDNYVHSNYSWIYIKVPSELVLEFMCDNLGIPYEQNDLVAKEIIKSNKACSKCGGTGKLDFEFYQRKCGCSL